MTTDLTNHWRKQYENKYLGVWDLFDRTKNAYKTVEAKIEVIHTNEVINEGRKSYPLQLQLRGSKGPIPMPMIVSKPNGKTLEAMYGPLPKDWIGKTVTLYAKKKSVKGQEAFVLTIRSNRGNEQLRQEMAKDVPPVEWDDAKDEET